MALLAPRAFLARGALDFLGRLRADFGPCGDEALGAAVAALARLDDPRHLHPDDPVLVATLGALRGAAYTVSDRLTARFFGQAAAIQRTSLAG